MLMVLERIYFFGLDTLKDCGDILQPGGQLESTGHFQMVIH